MSQSTKRKFHQEIRTVDLPDIAGRFKSDKKAFLECQQVIDTFLNRIQRNPTQEGKPCEFEPLSSVGFRKVKLFSTKNQPKGESPDLRIIYRYDAVNDAVEILAIGFRVKQRPRPPEDPYNRAATRDLLFE
jgi:hypothetical protein